MLKNSKDPFKGVPKIKILNSSKHAFSVFCQKILQAMDEVEKFFCEFLHP
jgi:hypothetical protein